MLTIGNFLGGQWAQKAGAVMGMGSKVFILIMVYAFVIHARLFLLRGKCFQFDSMFTFISTLFTCTV
jgi:hypothetical protein